MWLENAEFQMAENAIYSTHALKLINVLPELSRRTFKKICNTLMKETYQILMTLAEEI